LKTQLYFWEPLIKEYKKSLKLVGEYYDRTKVVFDDIEKEAETYAENFYNKFEGSEYTDPASVAEWAEERGLERYQTLAIMKSNHLMMTISMLYHMWEQQIIRFTIGELRHHIRFDQKVITYAKAQSIFRLHDVDIISTKSWPKIKELKLIVNTIKHGDGDLANKLRKIRPDFFQSEFLSDTDILELHGAVLLDDYSLQVNEKDLKDYIDILINFWDEMPEIGYSEFQIIIDELNKK
jgi:hypothetical protein